MIGLSQSKHTCCHCAGVAPMPASCCCACCCCAACHCAICCAALRTLAGLRLSGGHVSRRWSTTGTK